MGSGEFRYNFEVAELARVPSEQIGDFESELTNPLVAITVSIPTL